MAQQHLQERGDSIPKAIAPDAGEQMYAMVEELFPICRSITGDGVRRTLDVIARHIPMTTYNVPTHTPVFDWTVPREWNIRDAWVRDPGGYKIIDFTAHNLHVVSYSAAVHQRLSLADLQPHLHSLPEQPDVIPYRTSYYHETWGFCLPHAQREQLPEGEYEVYIDATLSDGALTYGSCCLPGQTDDIVLISCHCCHPSLANDNLSGIAVATALANLMRQRQRRYTYLFLFAPGTIGAITWLAQNQALTSRVRHGLVLACLGDPGHLTYKQSRQGDAEIDRAVAHLLSHTRDHYDLLDFVPYGYDERQYNSPGFNLPVGCLNRTPYGQYPEYHTSADDLRLVRPDALHDSLTFCGSLLDLLEGNRTYVNTHPYGEPQLGKRGLYRREGGHRDVAALQMAMLWVLNLCDGDHTLLDIAERAGLAFAEVQEAAGVLAEHQLLRLVS